MDKEVIIVGAGPAGATAAMGLAQRGRDVLLIDRKGFPRDKTCGDAVPAGAIAIMREFGMSDKIEEAVERGEFHRADAMRLVSPRGAEVTAEFTDGKKGDKSYIAPRLFYDRTLWQHAIDSGAEFRIGAVKEPIIEDDQVRGVRVRFNGKTEEVRAPIVIGADGVTSVVGRRLRPDKHNKDHRAIALRAYVEDMEMIPHTTEFFLYKGILPGYAWIFPTGPRSANIGLGMRIDKFENSNEKLEEMLERFMQFPEMKRRSTATTEIRDVATWQLNFGSQRIQRAYDGAVLVGDAGGYINPLTGGGIHNALVSSKVATDVIDNALKQGDLSRRRLAEYEARCDELMWESMVFSHRMQRWLMRFPFAIDVLIRMMGGNSKFTKTFLEKL